MYEFLPHSSYKLDFKCLYILNYALLTEFLCSDTKNYTKWGKIDLMAGRVYSQFTKLGHTFPNDKHIVRFTTVKNWSAAQASARPLAIKYREVELAPASLPTSANRVLAKMKENYVNMSPKLSRFVIAVGRRSLSRVVARRRYQLNMNEVAKTLCVMGSRITLSTTMYYPCILRQMSSSCKVPSASHCHLHHSTSLRNPTKTFSVNLSTSSTQCWKCGKSRSASQKFCPSCNTIQPIADQVNHFELLGLKPDFNIDAHHLANLFKNLQRLYHPDKFSAASEEEQKLSAQHSSRTNKAYQTLLHPLSRAEYLLQLSGMVVQEADTDLDQEFLTTVLELNEELMEAETEELLAHLKQRVLLAHDLLMGEMGEAFSAGKPAAARPLVARAKYYSSLLHKIRHQERERGIAD